ncbi:hypothetical protein MYX06_00750 [Patescibacteria group bacterium AH-259-L05]|nr:hypothetical protein [Patescibacteria group bacterium AH-259-L05]
MFERKIVRKCLEKFWQAGLKPNIRTKGNKHSSSFYKAVEIVKIGKDYVEFEYISEIEYVSRDNQKRTASRITFPLDEIGTIGDVSAFGLSKQRDVAATRESLKSRFIKAKKSGQVIGLRIKSGSFYFPTIVLKVKRDCVEIRYQYKSDDPEIKFIPFDNIRHVEFREPYRVKKL